MTTAISPELEAILHKHCPELVTVLEAAEDMAFHTQKLFDAIARNASEKHQEHLRKTQDDAACGLIRAVKQLKAVAG